MLQIPVMDIRVKVPLNATLFEALESRFATPHVILTMVDVANMNIACMEYLVVHRTCLAHGLLSAEVWWIWTNPITHKHCSTGIVLVVWFNMYILNYCAVLTV